MTFAALNRQLQKNKTPLKPVLHLEDALLKEACELSLYRFVETFWDEVEPGVAFKPGWAVKAICDHLQWVQQGLLQNLLINVPPRNLKSSLACVFFPAWLFVQNPQERIIATSYSRQISTRDSVRCRRLIQSQKFQHLWQLPFADDSDTKTRFDLRAGGFRLATSVGAGVLGEGGNYLLVDDPNNLQRITVDNLDKDAEYFFNVLSSRHAGDISKFKKVVIQQRCFAKSTKVLTLTEAVPMQELRVGQLVASYNTNTARVEYKPIVAIAHFEPEPLVKLHLIAPTGSFSITCTPDHKIYTHQGLKEAQTLEPLDLFLDVLKSPSPRFVRKEDAKAEPTMCIQVEDNANFFCGELEHNILVSNCHLMDLTGQILKHNSSGTWATLILPMEYDPLRKTQTYFNKKLLWEDPRKKQGELLNPDLIDANALHKLKYEAYRGDVTTWAGQLQQLPVAKEGGCFKEKWFRYWAIEDGMPKVNYSITSWDTAFSTNAKAAYSAFCTIGLFPTTSGDTRALLLDCGKFKLEYPELKNVILQKGVTPVEFVNHNNTRLPIHVKKPDLTLIEAKASGYSLYQDLHAQNMLNLEKFEPQGQGSKEIRAKTASDALATGGMYLLKHADRPLPSHDLFKTELLNFPRGESMDLVDAFSQAIIYLKQYGLLG